MVGFLDRVSKSTACCDQPGVAEVINCNTLTAHLFASASTVVVARTSYQFIRPRAVCPVIPRVTPAPYHITPANEDYIPEVCRYRLAWRTAHYNDDAHA